jgi:mono/diheme cytochrome c family protein
MPYYQFKNLSDSDANAIVAFLRTVPGVNRTVTANTAPYDVQPTAPEWQAVVPTDLPASSAASGPTNGKYLATLACATCHTVEVTGATPRRIDATKAFQGGKVVTATVGGTSKMLQSANLTPDATGLMTWNTSQVANTILTAKGKDGTTALCGMRALANMAASDASDIATYLLSIPPVTNARTMTCQ